MSSSLCSKTIICAYLSRSFLVASPSLGIVACKDKSTPLSESDKPANQPKSEKKATPKAPVAPAAKADDGRSKPYATPGQQGQPLEFRVVGVKNDDTLNLRAEPNAKSSIVGRIPPDATTVQALNERKQVGASNWMRVSYQGKQGWVNSRYLVLSTAKKDEQQKSKAGGVYTETLKCVGEEPPWSLSLATDGSLSFENMNGRAIRGQVKEVKKDPKNSGGWMLTMRRRGKKKPLTAKFKKTGTCASTMSDEGIFQYTITVTGALDDPIQGCCNKVK